MPSPILDVTLSPAGVTGNHRQRHLKLRYDVRRTGCPFHRPQPGRRVPLVHPGVVVDASPGSRFSFRIHFGPMPISLWSYDLAASPAGCVVTESWTDLRPKAYSYPARLIFGSRTARNRAGIRHTLQALKSSA
jgi:hypothetical protein